MAQLAGPIPVSSPAPPPKLPTSKATASAQGPTAAGAAARVPTAASNATKPGAPAAPKAQPRPTATAVKPVAASPAQSLRSPIPTPVDDMPTRVGPMPVAIAKIVQPTPIDLEQEIRPIVRALVEAALAPLERRLRDLQTRVDEFERRPAPTPVIMAASAPMHSFAGAYAPPQPSPVAGPVLNVAAIDRSVKLGSEFDIFDGRRRRIRLALSVAIGLIVLFGGLFAALAESYTHAHP